MPTIIVSKRQREAALMSAIDNVATVTSTEIEWHRNHTDTIIARIKSHTPDHGNREIPYKTLIVKIITAHREAQ